MDLQPRVGKLWSDDLVKQNNAILIHSTFKDNPFVPLEQRYCLTGQQNTINNKPQRIACWQDVYGLGLKKPKNLTIIFERLENTWLTRFFNKLPYQFGV
jgi:hypothetical protein